MEKLAMIQGIDISKWNGRGDWSAVKEAGVAFAFIRAGSVDAVTGKPYRDNLFLDHVGGALSVNIPFGFYWYFRPKWSPKMQADAFMDYALISGSFPPLPLVIDVEESGVTPAVLSLAVETMWNEMGKPRTLIYTRQSFWDFNVARSSVFAQMGLWAARWTSGITSPWSDGRYKFRDWQDWKFWQYSADGNALATTYGFPGHPTGDNDIDLNWYNGNEDQFAADFGLSVPLTLEQRVDDLTRRVEVLESRS
jgi:lysozyme